MIEESKRIEIVDTKILYGEGCNSLRHYSSCVINTRTVILAQGFLLLTAASYLATEGHSIQSLAICIFGLLFTLVLHALQGSYWRVFDVVLEVVVELESTGGEGGPWQAYYNERAERYETMAYRALVRHGPILILTLAFVVIAVYSCCFVKR